MLPLACGRSDIQKFPPRLPGNVQDDISLLQQPDAPHEAKLAALQQLQGLVEPIDNANGVFKL
jgi:Nucleotide exchange factor Fes1